MGDESGNIMKKVVVAAIGTGSLILTALGSYVLHASSKVEPLTVKTESIDQKLDVDREYTQERWADQKAWNQQMLTKQNQVDGKLDTLIRTVREHP